MADSHPPQHPLWDLFCAASLIGIWPRFIEPNLIFTTQKTLRIPHLPPALHGFKILQISDLHLHSQVSNAFLEKLASKIQSLRPGLIACTGDFLCHGQLKDPQRLRNWLQRLQAPYGCYAVLGNHDYAGYIAINSKGEYDVLPPPNSSVSSGFKRLKTITLTKTITERAKQVPLHAEFLSLLNDTPFILLHNDLLNIPVKDTRLNICGLGEHMLGNINADEAFRKYDKKYPGIILLHNPDGIPLLKGYPGDIVLCGHTHGGQINLPWLWKKFTRLENMHFKRGLIKVDDKWAYINRGIGSAMPLRCFSPPEILLLTLEQQE